MTGLGDCQARGPGSSTHVGEYNQGRAESTTGCRVGARRGRDPQPAENASARCAPQSLRGRRRAWPDRTASDGDGTRGQQGPPDADRAESLTEHEPQHRIRHCGPPRDTRPRAPNTRCCGPSSNRDHRHRGRAPIRARARRGTIRKACESAPHRYSRATSGDKARADASVRTPRFVWRAAKRLILSVEGTRPRTCRVPSRFQLLRPAL
jgi:hypothetical protein